MTRSDAYRNLLYFLVFTIFTAVFLAFSFPAERLTSLINDQVRTAFNGAVEIKETSIAFPWSVRLKGITTSISGKASDLGDATVSPDLSAIFTGGRGMKARFNGPAGTGRFFFNIKGVEADVVADPLNVDLFGVSRLLRLPVQIEGQVKGRLAIESADTRGNMWSGEGAFLAASVTMTGSLLEAFGMAPLNLSNLELFFTIKENILKFGENEVQGDIGAKVRGIVKLDPRRLENSQLDLVVELRPSEGTGKKLSPILTVMGARPGADGTVLLQIKGTAGRPAVTS